MSGITHSTPRYHDDRSGSPEEWKAEHAVVTVAPTGLTGATVASRYVGGTATGAPTTGTFAVNDWVTAADGHVFVCTVAGTPGTWVDAGSAAGHAALTIGADAEHSLAGQALSGVAASTTQIGHAKVGAATPTTQAFGDAPVVGAGDGAANVLHKHGMPASGAAERLAATAAAVAVGTAAVGVSAKDAREDHVHPTGAGTPSTQAFGDAAAIGSGPAAAMDNHKHAMPALGTTPSTQASGDAAAGGSATTPSKNDHKHGIPDIWIPVTFSMDGTLATGAGVSRWYNDSGRTLTIAKIRAAVGTAPSGASILVDVNIGGTTIWSTQGNRVAVAAASNTGTQTSFNTTTIADGSYFTMDIDQIGSGTPGADLTVTIWLKG